MSADDLDSDQMRRLRWRCRRGTKELDVVLARFVEQQYALLSAQECELFDEFLLMQDPVLSEWLFGQSKPQNQGMVNLVKRILSTNPA